MRPVKHNVCLPKNQNKESKYKEK